MADLRVEALSQSTWPLPGSRRRSLALEGALAEIARLGGGRVDGYPEDAEGRKVSMSYLNYGTVAMFEHHGFTRDRRIFKHRWVVHRVVPAS